MAYTPGLSVHSLAQQLVANPLVESSLCINEQGHIAVQDRVKVAVALKQLSPGSIEYAVVQVAIAIYDREQKEAAERNLTAAT